MAARARTAARLAAVAVSAATTAAALIYARTSGGWSLELSRDQVALVPRPYRSCPRCQGEGGWWIGGPFPEMEACPCWSDRRERRLRLRRPDPRFDEPPF